MKKADDTLEDPTREGEGAGTLVDGADDGAPALVQLDEPPSRAAERYAFKRALGLGGMGEINLVRDMALGRDVALKQLRPETRALARTVSRFEHEARLQAQLEHPAIVPVYDFGVRPDGTPFFTMKRVRGEELAHILDRLKAHDPEAQQRFTRRRLLSALSQVCLAAHYAHERGVVHRDIKPGNIMLGDYGEVYLLDWGIAKVLAEERMPTQSFDELVLEAKFATRPGTIVGTLRSIAPEQAINAGMDRRADVYSLGAVLYEILTLEPLHGTGHDHEILYRIIEGVDPRPALRAAREEVPPELEEIVVRATKRHARERYPSARALHEAIEAYLDGDRDLALRRAGSARHAEAARAELERALRADEGVDTALNEAGERARRGRALREVGKALALDPDNREALRTLVDLLTNPPRWVPPAVRADQEAMWRTQIRRGGIAGAIVYTYISINAAFTAALGIHDWHVFWVAHGLWAGSLVASFVAIARPSYGALFAMFGFGICASLWNTGVYGPHLLVPVFITMHAAAFAIVRYRWLRVTMLGIAVLAWTISVFGEMAGMFPDVVRFVDGGIFIRSPVLDFPETLTTVYLWAAVVALIAFPALIIGYLRQMYHAADQQTRLQSWQLHQLLSDETTDTIRERASMPPDARAK